MSISKGVCMIGSLPEPYGGVSTLCYYLSSTLARKYRLPVSFLDTNTNSDIKHKPVGVKVYKYYPTSLKNIIKNTLLSPRLTIYMLIALLPFMNILGLKGIITQVSLGWRIFQLARDSSIALLHSFHALERSLVAIIVGKYLNKPVIVTALGAEVSYQPILQKKASIVKYVLLNAAHVIAISKFTAECVRNICPIIPTVIYPGITVPTQPSKHKLHEIQNKYNLLQGITILYVGHLIDRKGPQILLKAIKHLSHHPIRVLLIGPDRGELENLNTYIAQMNLHEIVSIAGTVDQSELDSLYHSADIFVFPTIANTEGFGLVAGEAMASGLPVVASRIAAIPEVVQDGFTGLLFNPGDPDDLADKLNYLIENPSVRKKFSLACKDSIPLRFSWTKSTCSVMDIYRHISFEIGENQGVLRLNIGSGHDILPGFINSDLALLPGVDVICDFQSRPFPFRANSFTEIHLINVLEHLGNTVNTMEEIHRIAENGATIKIRVPYWNSIEMNTDPTHLTVFSEHTLDYFDPSTTIGQNRMYYSNARFRIRRIDCWIHFRRFKLIKHPRLKRILLGISHYINNIVRLLEFELEAIK